MSQTTKIYVGNLSYESQETDLENHFSQYGELTEVKLIKDMSTGRSKGFAFLTFAHQKEAEAALESNNCELQGRKIRVNVAQNNNRRGGQSGWGGDKNYSNRSRY